LKISIFGAVLAVGATFAAPLSAQNGGDTLSAQQPAGIVIALLNAGYDATLETDDFDDPLIKFEGQGYKYDMLFYGCDEAAHDKCDSVQLRVGFDRAKPWTAQDAIGISREYRYLAVSLDDEGDPYLLWDIVTGEGIPAAVFLDSVTRFEENVGLAAELIFAEENAETEAEAVEAAAPAR
jgi:Putative bacterial sensory transduction regulator